MTDLDSLYQALILDHNRRPRNWGELAGADGRQDGHNPLCGDRLTVWVRLDGDTIADVSFVGAGCAISKASASLMTTAVKGKTRAEAEALFERFHDLVTGKTDAAGRETLGRLAAFGGVSRFPARVKCASLSWHTMKAALQQSSGPAPTE
jgi:nitrogen fixation NifU-like protein